MAKYKWAKRHTPKNLEISCMMKTLDTLNPQLQEALYEFENAIRMDEVKGGGHPGDIPSIEEYYDKSIERLIRILINLCIK